ncbi:MAG: exodeoxyribonuclease VII small subunit [Dehalococcoidia bacterium]|nr:MAG: exodeoxyribonuclease VII small subunit [Dehalococcoidia bacterium]
MDEGLSFEQALKRLETITEALQKGGMNLEEMLALFEEGAALAKTCHERLNKAELKLSEVQTMFEKDEESEESA